MKAMKFVTTLTLILLFVDGAELSTSRPTAAKCDLCSQKWLFVVGLGRSGSTSLKDMLNGIDGYYIAGENGNAIGYLKSFWDGLHTKKFIRSAISPGEMGGPESHYPLDEEALLCDLQRTARNILGTIPPQTKVIGWKEIRWGAKVKDFMDRLFPCARYIINTSANITRAVQSRMRSGWRKQWSYEDVWDKQKSLKLWAAQKANRTFNVALEDFSVGLFNSMAMWLGNNCKFNLVSHANKDGGYEHSKHRPRCIVQKRH